MNLMVKAYGKVNLWLDITGSLDNGYHSLNTVMRRIDLFDEIELKTGDKGIKVSCDNPFVPSDERNIAYKAAAAFYEATGLPPEISIAIKKVIPVEAGLGGSSTDGAAVLTALNTLYGDILSKEELIRMGTGLGADVPFCITGGTAKCGGIGDIITPMESGELYLVIVKPNFVCNTTKGYRSYDRCPLSENSGFSLFCEKLDKSCLHWGKDMYNIFERLYNNYEISDIKDALMDNGAHGALMSGSGSSVFGVFNTMEEAEKCFKAIPYDEKYVVRAL